MSIFNKKIKEIEADYEEKLSEYKDLVEKATNSLEEFEEMYAREQLSENANKYLERGKREVQDPYYSVSIVRNCIHKIASNVAATPFEITTRSGRPLSDNHRLLKLWNYINEDDDPYSFFYELITSLYRSGKGFIKYSDKKMGGLPISLFTLDAKKMTPIKKNGFLTQWEYNKTTLQKEDVLFFRFVHPDDKYEGLSPVETTINEIIQHFYLNVFNLGIFEKGGQPKGYWTRDKGTLTASQLKELNKALDDTFSGISNQQKQKAVQGGVRYEKVSDSQKDMEFINLLHETRDAIFQAFEIPKAVFGFTDTTFNNMGEAKKAFWTQTLIPLMRQIENKINSTFMKQFNQDYLFRFKIETIRDLQLSDKERREMALMDKQLGIPLYMINEKLDLGYDIDEEFEEEPKPFEVNEHYVMEKMLPQYEHLRQAELKRTQDVYKGYEDDLYGEIKRFYNNVYKNKIEPLFDNKSIDPALLEKILDAIRTLDLKDDFLKVVESKIEEIFNRGMSRSYQGLGISFDVKPELAAAYVREAGIYLQNSPDVVKNEIIKYLESNNETIEDVSKEISKKWDKASRNSARRIARTETTKAYSKGKMKGMEELNIKKHQWVSAKDEDVRDDHRLNDGEIREIGQPFPNGERYPGEQSINCRCTTISIFED